MSSIRTRVHLSYVALESTHKDREKTSRIRVKAAKIKRIDGE